MEALEDFQNGMGALLTDRWWFPSFQFIKITGVKSQKVFIFVIIKNGSKLFLSPEKDAISIQETLGADIIMSFDECPPPYASYDYMKDSVDRTIRWAKRGQLAHTKKRSSTFLELFKVDSIKNLRSYCAEALIKLDFPWIFNSGLSVGETKAEMYEITKFFKSDFTV